MPLKEKYYFTNGQYFACILQTFYIICCMYLEFNSVCKYTFTFIPVVLVQVLSHLYLGFRQHQSSQHKDRLKGDCEHKIQSQRGFRNSHLQLSNAYCFSYFPFSVLKFILFIKQFIPCSFLYSVQCKSWILMIYNQTFS